MPLKKIEQYPPPIHLSIPHKFWGRTGSYYLTSCLVWMQLGNFSSGKSLRTLEQVISEASMCHSGKISYKSQARDPGVSELLAHGTKQNWQKQNLEFLKPMPFAYEKVLWQRKVFCVVTQIASWQWPRFLEQDGCLTRVCDPSLKSYCFVQRCLVYGKTQPTHSPQVTCHMLQADMKGISLNSGCDTISKDLNFHSLSPILIRKKKFFTHSHTTECIYIYVYIYTHTILVLY